MASNFWHSPGVEPKRNFRFELRISEEPNMTWLVKTCEKPKLDVSTTPHKYINHTFNYPGRVVWSPVAITMVDVPNVLGGQEDAGPGQTDTTGRINQFLAAAGYRTPGGDPNISLDAAATNMDKKTAVAALGKIYIRQLANIETASAAGFGPPKPTYVDEWELHNAFIQGSVAFGTLDYASEDITTVSFALQYDWAVFKDYARSPGRGPGG